MMGRQAEPEQLFYDFRLDDHVPADHLLRKIDVFVDLERIRQDLKPFHSQIGRPSADPELMIRMLIIGYCYGIRSERRLCEDVHLNLAFRWFCRLDLNGRVPDQSTFSSFWELGPQKPPRTVSRERYLSSCVRNRRPALP